MNKEVQEKLKRLKVISDDWNNNLPDEMKFLVISAGIGGLMEMVKLQANQIEELERKVEAIIYKEPI